MTGSTWLDFDNVVNNVRLRCGGIFLLRCLKNWFEREWREEVAFAMIEFALEFHPVIVTIRRKKRLAIMI